jgi:hypothetical protein
MTRKNNVVRVVNSRRWLMEAECKRLGWVMVPYNAGVPLSKAVASSFDTLQKAITVKQLVVHTSLLDLIERLEAALIEKLCDLATTLLVTRSDRWTQYEMAKTEKEKSDIEVFTNEVAMAFVSDLLEALFARLHRQITDYALINSKDPQDKLMFLELECLEDKVKEDVLKIVGAWK